MGDDQEVKDTQSWQENIFTGPDSLHPDDVAKIVVEAIKENRFFILTPKTEDFLATAMDRGRDYQKLEQHLQDTYKV